MVVFKAALPRNLFSCKKATKTGICKEQCRAVINQSIKNNTSGNIYHIMVKPYIKNYPNYIATPSKLNCL